MQGTVTVKVDPSPSLLSTSIVPPIRSTSFFTIPIPMPMPSIWVIVEVRSLSNASKICFWNSSVIPIPLSVIRMIISHQSSFSQGLCATLQDIVPPAFVYLTALLMMLMQTSDKCGSSTYTYGYRICSVMHRVWFLLSACCWNIVTQFVKSSRTSDTAYFISTLLFSILARSRTLLSNDNSFLPHI